MSTSDHQEKHEHQPKQEQEGEKRDIQGGCHCGFIRYTATVTLNAEGNLTATRCNCTFCQKLGSTNLTLPPSSFTLQSPSSPSFLSDYNPRVKTVHRYFCPTCGAHVWMEGAFPHEGKMWPFFAVNLCTVDQPQEGVEMSKTRIGYYDMLADNVEGGVRWGEGPWEGGLI